MDKNEDSYQIINSKTISSKLHSQIPNSTNSSFKLIIIPKLKKLFNNNKLFSYQKASGNVTLLKKLCHNVFIEKYYNDKNFYNKKVIDDILENQPTHIVCQFKEYLLYGDESEFFSKFFKRSESKKFLPKIFEFYENCSVIFPNYVILSESKYIYNNIHKKQKLIDLQREHENEEKLENEVKNEENKTLLNTKIINSILAQTNTSNINRIFGINNSSIQLKEDKYNDKEKINDLIELFENIEKEKVKTKINIKKHDKKIPSFNEFIKESSIKKNYRIKSFDKNSKNEINKIKNNKELINQINNKRVLHKKVHSYSRNNSYAKNAMDKNKNQNQKKNENSNINKNLKMFNKIPKSKLLIDLDNHKKHQKLKTTINEQEVINSENKNVNGFFSEMLKKKILKHDSKICFNLGKTIKIKSNPNNYSIIPIMKKIEKIINNEKSDNKICNSCRNKNSTLENFSMSSSRTMSKKINSKEKIPIIFMRELKINSIVKSRNKSKDDKKNTSAINKSYLKRKSSFVNEKKLIGTQIKEKTHKKYSDIMTPIAYNSLSITERCKNNKSIYFTIVSSHIPKNKKLNKFKNLINQIQIKKDITDNNKNIIINNTITNGLSYRNLMNKDKIKIHIKKKFINIINKKYKKRNVNKLIEGKTESKINISTSQDNNKIKAKKKMSFSQSNRNSNYMKTLKPQPQIQNKKNKNVVLPIRKDKENVLVLKIPGPEKNNTIITSRNNNLKFFKSEKSTNKTYNSIISTNVSTKKTVFSVKKGIKNPSDAKKNKLINFYKL